MAGGWAVTNGSFVFCSNRFETTFNEFPAKFCSEKRYCLSQSGQNSPRYQSLKNVTQAKNPLSTNQNAQNRTSYGTENVSRGNIGKWQKKTCF